MKSLRSPFDETPYLCVHCGWLNTDPLDRIEEYCTRCSCWSEPPRDRWDRKYIVHEKQVIPASIRNWSKFMEVMSLRRVAETETATTRVSTVFLGLDYNWQEEGPPQLFETMVFYRAFHEIQRFPGMKFHDSLGCMRCATWDEAVVQHNQAVERILETERGALAKLKETVQ